MSGTKINAFCKLRTAARAAVCLLFLFFCAGCAGEDTKSILEYQTALQSCLMEEEAAGTLFARMWEIVPRPDGFTVRLCPEGERGGITFFLTESGASASAGGITLPVSDAMSRAARHAAACFSLREEMLVSVTPSDAAAPMTAHFRSDGAEYTVSYGEDGLPIRFETVCGGVHRRYAVRSLQLHAPEQTESAAITEDKTKE